MTEHIWIFSEDWSIFGKTSPLRGSMLAERGSNQTKGGSIMVQHTDTIQFESREEIRSIIEALEKSDRKDDETVKQLIGLLDVMDMGW